MNIFYSYDVEKREKGWMVIMYDLDNNQHDVCLCYYKKVADTICQDLDDLSIGEERELFNDPNQECCEKCGTFELPCNCNGVRK